MRFIQFRMVLAATLLTATIGFSAAAMAQDTLAGVYKGNGKPASLTQVTAHRGDAESGKSTVVVMFTARNPWEVDLTFATHAP